MSSYDQYFFRTWKYGLQAFQNRAGKCFTTSQSIFTTLNASAKKQFFTPFFGGDEKRRKWPISVRYVWCSKKRMRYRKIISETVLESLDFIRLGSWKILTLRTPPEELRGLKVDQHCVSNTHYKQFLGPRSSSGWVLKVNNFQEPKSMESKLSKTVSGIILRYLIRFLEHQT